MKPTRTDAEGIIGEWGLRWPVQMARLEEDGVCVSVGLARGLRVARERRLDAAGMGLDACKAISGNALRGLGSGEWEDDVEDGGERIKSILMSGRLWMARERGRANSRDAARSAGCCRRPMRRRQSAQRRAQGCCQSALLVPVNVGLVERISLSQSSLFFSLFSVA